MRGAPFSVATAKRQACTPPFPATRMERIDKTMPTAESKTPKIVGKEELAHLIAARAHVDLKQADAMLDALTDTVREEVAKGHQVRLMGFGSWKLTAVSARTIKSIRGGAPLHLPAGKRVSFSTGSLLAEAAKAPTSAKKAPASKPAAKKGAK